jgi:hypothetical protein
MRKILFVFFLAHVNTSPLSSDSAISVTVGMMDRYHATCVLLLYPQPQRGESNISFQTVTCNGSTCMPSSQG